MTWDRVILSQSTAHESLATAVEHLFACQREEWPTFRQGEAALSDITKKTIAFEGAEVVVQSNPGRRKSTHAKTDSSSIAARKCFLCPENMPPEERGIAHRNLVILPNPFPILGLHCTIPDRLHCPQHIEGRLADMLELAQLFGPEIVVFYNGPRCGASAPDHFHFQACRAEGIPLIRQLSPSSSTYAGQGCQSFGRRFLAFAGAAEDVVRQIERTIVTLQGIANDNAEPMINLIVYAVDEGFRALLFPRQAHRPSCYFALGNEQLAISPAALEMAGVLVVAEPEHFDRVDADTVRQIYDEVSLDPSQFSQLVEALR